MPIARVEDFQPAGKNDRHGDISLAGPVNDLPLPHDAALTQGLQHGELRVGDLGKGDTFRISIELFVRVRGVHKRRRFEVHVPLLSIIRGHNQASTHGNECFIDDRVGLLSAMNISTLPQLEARLHRVERQNRILIALLCTTAGLALLGATKENNGGKIISADEVRAHRLALIGDDGQVVHSWTVHGGWIVEK
jgi:hypothetical protein